MNIAIKNKCWTSPIEVVSSAEPEKLTGGAKVVLNNAVQMLSNYYTDILGSTFTKANWTLTMAKTVLLVHTTLVILISIVLVSFIAWDLTSGLQTITGRCVWAGYCLWIG